LEGGGDRGEYNKKNNNEAEKELSPTEALKIANDRSWGLEKNGDTVKENGKSSWIIGFHKVCKNHGVTKEN